MYVHFSTRSVKLSLKPFISDLNAEHLNNRNPIKLKRESPKLSQTFRKAVKKFWKALQIPPWNFFMLSCWPFCIFLLFLEWGIVTPDHIRLHSIYILQSLSSTVPTGTTSQMSRTDGLYYHHLQIHCILFWIIKISISPINMMNSCVAVC